MINLLQRNKNIKIVTEFCPFFLKSFGVGGKEYLKMLQKFGFEFYNIDEMKNKIEPLNTIRLLKKLLKTYAKGGFTNLLCIKRKK